MLWQIDPRTLAVSRVQSDIGLVNTRTSRCVLQFAIGWSAAAACEVTDVSFSAVRSYFSLQYTYNILSPMGSHHNQVVMRCLIILSRQMSCKIVLRNMAHCLTAEPRATVSATDQTISPNDAQILATRSSQCRGGE